MDRVIFSVYAKFQKVTVSFILSAHPQGTIWLPLDEFYDNSYLSIFRKFVKKMQVSLEYDINNAYLS